MTDLTRKEVEELRTRAASGCYYVRLNNEDAERIAQALLAAWDALEEVEWNVPLGRYSSCPSCGGTIESGHVGYCKLAAALPKGGE